MTNRFPNDATNGSAKTTPDRGQPPAVGEASGVFGDRPLRVSQTHLNRLEFCPRHFQDTILDRREPPLPPDKQARLAQGNRFHLLMQRWALDLPLDAPALDAAEDAPLQRWLSEFLERAPQQISPDPVSAPARSRAAEHERTLEFALDAVQILLVVRYDLLLFGEDTAHILDWKTYRRPPHPRWLQQNWQTRLYPFVLAETSDYSPEAIAFTYWFVEGSDRDASARSDTPPRQSWTFRYSRTEHDRTRRDLASLLARLLEYWPVYERGGAFPSRYDLGQDCDRPDCFCPRVSPGDRPLTLDAIPEVQI